MHFNSNYNVTVNGPKIQDHFSTLLATYHHIPIIFIIYFLTVKVIGPSLMSERKPFDLKIVLRIYNLTQVLINSYLLYLIIFNWGYGILKSWNHVCNPITETVGFDHQIQLIVLKVMYYYYLNKILDLMDTVFFVLRKKQSHITFLHLFHHTTMILSTWITVVYFREQVGAIFGFLNITVHIFMYSYYLLSSFGPWMQRYLWWKKHLTRMQMLQFILMLAILAKMKMVNCTVSPGFWTLWCFNITSFFILFLQFYIKSYRKKKVE
ncbi:very long chain fatty acid elongase 7 isoform X1 [Halyomorpha halys]|uniref:very long chain fatty acid elongase 7 isoform X1 n=2 Tax=Halyomorpha halys TaxID=286706 RepID=UPI0006D4DC7E|nr:elongation of very long chain fatty acids protein 7-like [Halyomorpha halys]